MKILAKIKKRSLILGILFAMLLIGIVYAAEYYQVNSGAQATINEWSVCKKVTNNNALAIFVPTKTEAEWTAFRTYASGVTYAECCECTQGSNCATGSYCRQSDCTCQSVPVCQIRVEAGYGTTNVTDNTQATGCTGTCQACQSGACGVANADTDPGSDCGTTDCYTGNCKGTTAVCGWNTTGDGNCATCKKCVGATSGTCLNYTNNTQDTGCTGTCQACQSGSCGVANAGTDPGVDCGTTDCYTGNCKGTTAVCGWNTTGEGNCAVCKYCQGATSSTCVNRPNDTQDSTSPNLCNATCDYCTAGTCTGGTQVTCYPDSDGDGYGASTGGTTYCDSCPAGKSLSNTDCCDSDNRAKPGQTTYYTSTNNCGSWDYNCDSATTKNWNCDYITSCVAQTTCTVTGCTGGWTWANWYTSTRACGITGNPYACCGTYGNTVPPCTSGTVECRTTPSGYMDWVKTRCHFGLYKASAGYEYTCSCR